MKKFIVILLLISMVNYTVINAKENINKSYALDNLEITSKAAILVEASSGKVLYEKNADDQLKPASVTKIMTLLLALEEIDKGNMKLNDTITISEHAASMGGSQCFFEEGEKQSVDDILKCIEVSSGNDAAVAMAEHISGSEEDFVELMNKRAKELQMNNTCFKNACGLEISGHVTSARDIAIMSRELITKHTNIFDYSNIWMDSIVHRTNRGEARFDLANTNKFLKLYNGANGLKTGFTNEAKFCMSATATKNGITLIAVIMGAETKDIRNNEAIKLLDYGFDKCNLYKDKYVLPDNYDILVHGGNKSNIKYESIDNVEFVVFDKDINMINKQIKLNNIEAPVFKGEIIGYIEYLYGDTVVYKENIIAAENVYKKSISIYLKDLSKRFFMIK